VAVLIKDEQVSWREVLAVGQVDEVGDGAAVYGREEGK
jgi:hypothetical protein